MENLFPCCALSAVNDVGRVTVAWEDGMANQAIASNRGSHRLNVYLGVAAIFWVIAYAVLSVYAKLDPASQGQLVSEARFLSTAAGTALLLGILLLWDRLGALETLLRVKMVALAIGASCATMYAVRLIAAREFGSYGATELADGGRWVIAWAGYFLATVSTTIAWKSMREMDALQAVVGRSADYECADDPFGLAP
jgi:hypothetical protein